MRLKSNVRGICGAAILALTLSLFLAPAVAFALPSARPAEGQPPIIIEKFRTSQGNVTATDDRLSIQLNPLTKPGDYAEITLTVWNRGSREVRLVQEEELDCGLEDISVSFPQLEVGERLQPGDRCTLTLIVAWDSDSELSYPAEQAGTFGLKLKYESNTVSMVPDTPGSVPPYTGDNNMLASWALLLVCSGIGALLCLLLLLRRKEAP